ncbi:MAG: hypothetical protein D6816_09575 [Bacteroidetes bacterium]|nr:MAG: hypothetical protein D6816_09575 [Bacteroidota bacterium]
MESFNEDPIHYSGKGEAGFVLVVAVVLIGVLTVLGATGAYKAVIESKVSGYVGDLARAEQVAVAGLNRMNDYLWNCKTINGRDGCAERRAIESQLQSNTGSDLYSFVPGLTGDSLADLETVTAGLDAYVQASGNIMVFTLDANGAPLPDSNANWGAKQNPQVAVWVTSYARDNYGYPYETPSTQCKGKPCQLVVYALGRDGESRALVRQVAGVFDNTLKGVSAITHAPPYSNWMDFCHDRYANAVGAAISWDSGAIKHDVFVEATQAPYKMDVNPSGTALIANTNMGIGGKKFRKARMTTNELTMDSTPGLLYSTHDGPYGVRALWASNPEDASSPPSKDPFTDIPKKLMISGAAATSDRLDYFSTADGQLFELDAYRWAAEQFTCQRFDPYSAVLGTSADPYANGAFCEDAFTLAQKVYSEFPTTDAADTTVPPVTGRISIYDFWRNVRDGRPMFGIVRVMYPTTKMPSDSDPKKSGDTGQNCEIINNEYTWLYDVVSSANNIKPTASIKVPLNASGSPPTINIGNKAKVIVYGMLLMDYFTDNDGDGYFDADSERLLRPIESTDAYLKVEVPFMVNPVLPANGSEPFPTIADTYGNPYSSGNDLSADNRINANDPYSCTSCRSRAALASPYDGWFPAGEGIPPQSTNFADSAMAAMELTHSDATYHNSSTDVGLIGVFKDVYTHQTAASPSWGSGSRAENVFSNFHDRLNYYYELMYQTADRTEENDWPITGTFPSTLSNNFCIGKEDCAKGGGDHLGDKLHLLFPSGYAQGWKVALAALNIQADDWNSILSGGTHGGVSIVQLKSKHGTKKPYGDSILPLGSPFGEDGSVTDAGMGKASDLMANQNDYFYVTEDSDTGYGLLDADFADLPALTYSGGLVDSHSYSNVSGVVYTPSSLEWEPGNKGGLAYITGAVVTGLGMYNKSGGDKAHSIFVFDPQASDNITTKKTNLLQAGYGRQWLK